MRNAGLAGMGWEQSSDELPRFRNVILNYENWMFAYIYSSIHICISL